MEVVCPYRIGLAAKRFLEIALHQTVPQTDTGGLVENTKALERTMLKELGKMPPYLRKKEDLARATGPGWHRPGGSDCLLKTQGSAKSQDDV